MNTTDTIAAISTALSPSGIGIVRLSGEDSIEIADRIYRGKRKLALAGDHTVNYGFIVDPHTDEKVDQVLVILMKAPATYTGEDTVEIDCHGGVLVLKKILRLALDAGAVLASPGEFTKRAFLNGKIDLSQAEAVADIIDAENTNALNAGMKQLRGTVSGEIKALREKLLLETAFIEAALDDPEHYSLDDHSLQLRSILSEIKERIEKLILSSGKGKIIRSGINTAIIGRPNAGKSSVYNLLTGSDSAIVTDIEGTTRDILTEHITLSGISLNITDTAGIRESRDTVEKIGVERAREAAENADLVLFVVDSSRELTTEDISIMDLLKDKRSVVLLNKSDLAQKVGSGDIPMKHIIDFSAKTGAGVAELEKLIADMFFSGEINVNDEIIITAERHLHELENAKRSIELSVESLDMGYTEDIISVDMQDAYHSLGKIIGESAGEDVINEIFSKFCMGK